MKNLILITTLVLMTILGTPNALACGGRDTIFTSTPDTDGVETKYFPKYGMLSFDAGGILLLSEDQLKVTEIQAEAMLIQYLKEKFGYAPHLIAEGFHYEHGSPSYMFRAEYQENPVSYHVGNVKFITTTHRYHVDAITAEVYDQGCGGGPGIVVGSFNPEDFTFDMCFEEGEHHLTGLVIPSGKMPIVDGGIMEDEWSDAAEVPVQIGTATDSTTFYGCGGPGKQLPSGGKFDISTVWFKTVGDNLAVGVRTTSQDSMTLLLKDFGHNGMIGDFNDAKVMTAEGISDFFLSSSQQIDYPVRKSGSHGCFGYGRLYKDKTDHILESSVNVHEGIYEYEFLIPLSSGDVGDIDWDKGGSYMFSLARGLDPKSGIFNGNVWISEQIIVTLSSEDGHVDHSH